MRVIGDKLASFWRLWARAWQVVLQDLREWGIWSDGPAVRVVDHSGQVWRFDGRGTLVPWKGGATARHQALLLDPDMVLEGRLRIPASERDVSRAAEWEVRAISPFAAEDTLWVWSDRVGEGDHLWRHIDLFLTHSGNARRWMDQRIAAGAHGLSAELWAAPGVPFPGFGERVRFRRRRLQNRAAGLLFAGMLGLVVVAALWPVWQTREHLLEAERLVGQLERASAEAAANRARVTAGVERIQSLEPWIRDTPDPLTVLDLMTRAFPDSAFLEHYQQQGRRIQVRGVASDTAALMQGLRDVPPFTGVRSPAAIARDPQTGRERFQIELEWRPGDDVP